MNTSSRRQFIQHSAAGLAMAAFSPHGQAQSQPLEVAKIVVGFAPGGTIDLAARRVADKLHPGYARTVVVENRTGAGGQIAVQAIRTSAPDGSAILITPTSPLSLHRFTYRTLPYDPATDVVPVSGAAMFDYALAVGPQVPAQVRTAADFLRWAKANPANANFGSAGAGSAANLIGSALGKLGGADLRHVGFRGSQPAILDMIGGQIAAVVGPTGEFMPNVKAGKCRLLATSGPARGRFTPDTPTLVEQGFQALSHVGWFGFYVPARTPQAVVARLHDGIGTALAAPDVIESLASVYMEPMPASAARLEEMLAGETRFWEGLVKSVGYTAEG
ncbi:Bug family tripartite tricarboxylate transporter substrate binding protein [Xenophilus azovorans]|uniref:Bug family tripartite tricarboxylate transporter substrate binding protein n=1 Tax=Xenophilus azovorans TaxID=151755 RepID=UPI000570910D|nr:Bug family tripartite tricarboxylate transporter substrate binding protein [Xenophilus azovorans]